MNTKFLIYILKRIGLGIVTYAAVVTATFWIMQMVPGGPMNREGKAVSDAVYAAMMAKYGLDKPLFVQYLIYLGRALTFDFGFSYHYKGQMVVDILLEGFKISFLVGAAASVIALIFGLFFGTFAALNHNKFFDRFIMVLTTGSVAVPTFVISLILLYIFAVILKILPTSAASNNPAAYVLPIISEALYPTAYITRLCRSSTLDVIGQDFMRTAKAKGLAPAKIILKHGLRNSVTPVITYFGPMFASIITGSLVVEQIFSIPGVGRKFFVSITNRDYPLIMGTTCMLALLLIAFTLVSDILYKVVNPRVDFD